MKLSVFLLSSLTEGSNRIGKPEANQFLGLERNTRANTGLLTEEFRTGNLERECVEEACDVNEAIEIFEDENRAKQYVDEKTHMCENVHPCWGEGTNACVNKWANY